MLAGTSEGLLDHSPALPSVPISAHPSPVPQFEVGPVQFIVLRVPPRNRFGRGHPYDEWPRPPAIPCLASAHVSASVQR